MFCEECSGEPTQKFDYNDYLRYLELRAGTVRLDQSIRESSSSRLLSELAYLHHLGFKAITLSISSPGGDAYHAFAIYDALIKLQKEGVKVTALVEGWAASAASMIVLQAAGVRKARANARFLLHEARRWVFFAIERTSDLVDEVGEMKAIECQIVSVLSKRSGRSEEEVGKLIERKEVWMSATQAKEWGLIDEVV